MKKETFNALLAEVEGMSFESSNFPTDQQMSLFPEHSRGCIFQ
jgi:hypothetical protein